MLQQRYQICIQKIVFRMAYQPNCCTQAVWRYQVF